MIKSYKYRLYPNKGQIAILERTLSLCCELYNAALQERRDAWSMCHVRIAFFDQVRQIPEIRQIREEYQGIYAQVLMETVHRVDRTFKAFFARCKRGETPGFPRYKSRKRYDSFTFPEGGFKFNNDTYLHLSKIGDVKIRLTRPIEGKMKTCTIKREGEHWYVTFTCEVERPEPLPVSNEEVGIDLGVLHLATLSTGETIEHPRHLRKAAKKLEKLQQALARKKRGSHRRNRARKAIARVHRKIARQRRDFLHKESRKLVNHYQVIVFEELEAAHLTKRPKPKQDENGKYLPNGASAKAGLNKSILDAGWYIFVELCTYKAAEAGRTLLQVNPRYTSQLCSSCGSIVKKELAERWHSCSCGCELDRDHNAAINILRLGNSQRSQSVKGLS